MKIRRKKFEEVSPLEFLLLRDELALKKMNEKEENNYQIIGERRRRLKLLERS